MAKESSTDAFLNFKSWISATNATNAETLVEKKLNTGLSIRGKLVWLVHLIEIFIDARAESGVEARYQWALCTVAGLGALPRLTDKGVIAAGEQLFLFQTNGAESYKTPQQLTYLPPIPLAAPALSLYCRADLDNATFRALDVSVRVGFTTAPLDLGMYTEIAETWGY